MKTIAAFAAGAAALVAVVAPAQAKIVCRNGFQVVGGTEISTPYCRDNYLAHVARERGARVSDSAVRNNPNLKQEVCRLVGRDIRVQGACDSDGSGRDTR